MKAYRRPSRIQGKDDSYQDSLLNKVAVNCSGITTRSYVPFHIENNRKANNKKCFDDLSFKELLNVSNLVDLGVKGLPIPEHYSTKELRCAGRIVSLYHKKGGKEKAEGIISDLNHKIILENRKGLNRSEGKKLLNDLLK